jgi:type III secretion protein U
MHEGTEVPTAHRQRTARRHGQIAHSRMLTPAVVWIAFAAVVDAGAPRAWGVLASFAKASWAPKSLPRARMWSGGGEEAIRWTIGVLGWSLGAMIVGALAAGLLQTGAHLRPAAVAPDFGRLFAGRASLRAAGRPSSAGAVALLAIGVVTLATFVELGPTIFRLSTTSAGGVLVAGGMLTRQLVGRILVAMFFAGACDGLWRRVELRRDLMMTKDEVRRETRELEGDVRLKVERRRRAASADALAQPASPRGGATGDVVVVGYSTQSGTCAVVLRSGDRVRLADRVAAASTLLVVDKGIGPEATRIVDDALTMGLRVEEDRTLASALWFIRVGAPLPQTLSTRAAKFFREG